MKVVIGVNSLAHPSRVLQNTLKISTTLIKGTTTWFLLLTKKVLGKKFFDKIDLRFPHCVQFVCYESAGAMPQTP